MNAYQVNGNEVLKEIDKSAISTTYLSSICENGNNQAYKMDRINTSNHINGGSRLSPNKGISNGYSSNNSNSYDDKFYSSSISIYAIDHFSNSNSHNSSNYKRKDASKRENWKTSAVLQSNSKLKNHKSSPELVCRTAPQNSVISSIPQKSVQSSENVYMKKRANESQLLSRSRHLCKEELAKVAENYGKNNPNSRSDEGSSSDLSELDSILQKRILGNSKLSDILSGHHKPQNESFECSVDSSFLESSSIKPILKTSSSTSLRTRIELNTSSATAHFLKQSFEKDKSNLSNLGTPDSSYIRPALKPILNEEGGFYTIGPMESGTVKNFSLSVSVIYAKNLSQVVSRTNSHLNNEEYYFRYSLLGSLVETNHFGDLDHPDFLSETTNANIHSSEQSIEQYFHQNPYFSIQLMATSGDVLGQSTIDLGSLLDNHSRSDSTIEGCYEIEPCLSRIQSSSESILNRSISKSKDQAALVGVLVRLSKDTTLKPFSSIFAQDRIKSGYFSAMSSTNLARKRKRIDGCHESFSNRWKGSVSRDSYEGARESDQFSSRVGLSLLQYQKDRRLMLYEAGREVQELKEQQERMILNKLSSEADGDVNNSSQSTLNDWSHHLKVMETSFVHQLSSCNDLLQKLDGVIQNLDRKEELLMDKERRVSAIERSYIGNESGTTQDFERARQKRRRFSLIEKSSISKEFS